MKGNQFLCPVRMKNLARSVFQAELVRKVIEDKKEKALRYLGLITKALSLPSPVDSDITSLSSASSI